MTPKFNQKTSKTGLITIFKFKGLTTCDQSRQNARKIGLTEQGFHRLGDTASTPATAYNSHHGRGHSPILLFHPGHPTVHSVYQLGHPLGIQVLWDFRLGRNGSIRIRSTRGRARTPNQALDDIRRHPLHRDADNPGPQLLFEGGPNPVTTGRRGRCD